MCYYPKGSPFPKGGALRAAFVLPSVRHSRLASSHRPRLRRRGVPWLRTALRSVCSPLQPFGPPLLAELAWDTPLCPQFAIVVLLRYRLQSSCLSVQHGRSASFASSLAVLPASLGSSAAIAATGCAASFALIGLPLRLFPPLAAAKLRPHWAYFGLLRALRAAFVLPSVRHSRLPSLAELAWDTPLCPQFAIVVLLRYRLQSSFAHWTSASPVPATGGGEAPSPLGLLRPASRTARGLRAPPAKMPEMTYTPSFLMKAPRSSDTLLGPPWKLSSAAPMVCAYSELFLMKSTTSSTLQCAMQMTVSAPP